MKHFARLAAISTLLLLAEPVAAQCGLSAAPPPPGADAPAPARAAHDLATLYYPEAMIAAVVERQSRTAFEQGVRSSPGGDRILAEMPGLVEAGYEATMRVIRPCVTLMVPMLQQRAAAVLERRLSLAHLRDVANFYRSDTGRATMAAVAASMRPAIPRVREDGSIEPVTRQDLQGVISPAFVERLSPAQLAELAGFASSPHGRAFMAVTPELEQLTIAAINSMNTAAQAEVEPAVRAAVQDYLRRNAPSRRKS